ncbi:MAG TPA: hypothetical protein RMH99_19785 [Sandaracinaceae bacterium LLY-WYZ-13_1]|nr:hypothetical protein [Sandaracinaceae bacterium LLY-WYZ-13_1]
MRAAIPALALLCTLAACDGDDGGEDGGMAGEDAAVPSGPRAVLSWRMRCASGRCPAEEPPARSIDAVNGQDGHEVFCDLTLEGDERRLRLTARDREGNGIEVRGARVGPEGGRLLGSLCQIRVYETADVDVFGPCGSNNPTADRPCQLQRVDIREVDGVPTLTGELRCEEVPAEGDDTRLRDVTSPTSAAGHAELTFTGCLGL